MLTGRIERERLIFLLTFWHRAKDARLRELGWGGEPYLTSEDEAELREWPTDELARVWGSLLDAARLFCCEGLQSDSCAWCVRHGFTLVGERANCSDCGYGARHGECCTTSGSVWSKIIRELGADRLFDGMNSGFYRSVAAEAVRQSRYSAHNVFGD